MNVQPTGMPAALNAWRQRQPDALLTVRCPDCGAEVGWVYRSSGRLVVESWISVPQDPEGPTAFSVPDIAQLGDALNLTGLLDDVDTSAAAPPQPAEAEQTVKAQIDLLQPERYWQNPAPLCPVHGTLRIDREALAAAVREGHAVYEAEPDSGAS